MSDVFCHVGSENAGCGVNFHRHVNLKTRADVCPQCGMPHGNGWFGGGAVAASGRKVCPKCGLLQHSSIHSTVRKRCYNDLKCCDCNQPLIAGTGRSYAYCIRCGRIYDTVYIARHGNGSGAAGMVRCPKCGGNTKSYAAT